MYQSYENINQIFYKNNKFDDSESIKTLEKYFICNDLLLDIPLLEKPILPLLPPIENKCNDSSIVEQIIEKSDEKLPEIPKTRQQKWFLPRQTDTIFWCIYVFIYGLDEYDQIGHSYGNKILEEKQKMIDFIQKTPKVLKSSNVKITNNAIKEILSEFMVDKMTSFDGLVALSIYYKTPIYLINDEKKTYLKFLPETEYHDNKPCYLYLHKSERGFPKYKLYMSEIKPTMESLLCLESHLKPLKSASHYKMEDLHNIMDKIGFHYEEKMKKMELYEKLIELCSWNA
jgi:hypothetical protein